MAYFLYKQYRIIKVLSQRISDYDLLLKSGWKYSRTSLFGIEYWLASDENFDRPFGNAVERQRALGEIVRLNLPDPEAAMIVGKTPKRHLRLKDIELKER